MSEATFNGGALEDGPTCSECGEEWPHGCVCYSEGIKKEPDPDDFVQIQEDDPPEEPGEEDMTTADHINLWDGSVFGGHRKPAVVVREGQDWRREVKRYMLKQKFYPNVWFISDHGNAHLLNLNGDDDGEGEEVSETA